MKIPRSIKMVVFASVAGWGMQYGRHGLILLVFVSDGLVRQHIWMKKCSQFCRKGV